MASVYRSASLSRSEKTVRSVVRALIDEACIGEAIGAAEAAAAAEGCHDPAVRAVLVRVAADETRHAALAWRALAWALSLAPELRVEAKAWTFAAMKAAGERVIPEGVSYAAHGVPSPAERAAVHRAALRVIVEPCVAVVFGAPAGASSVASVVSDTHVSGNVSRIN